MPLGGAFQTFILPSLPFRRRSSAATAASSVLPLPELSHSPTSPISPTSTWSAAASSSPLLAVDQPAYLNGATAAISCSRCHAQIALTSQIVSKGFTGRHGRAYLVSAPPRSSRTKNNRDYTDSDSYDGDGLNSLPNTYAHRPVNRSLVTGAHRVSDVACSICHSVIGWRYIAADEDAQKYKVGKYILETRRTIISHWWEGSWNCHRTDSSAKAPPVHGADDMSISELEDESIDEYRPSATLDAQHSDRLNDLDEIFGGDATSLGICEGEDVDDIAFDSQDEDECDALFAGVWSPAFARRVRARKALA